MKRITRQRSEEQNAKSAQALKVRLKVRNTRGRYRLLSKPIGKRFLKV